MQIDHPNGALWLNAADVIAIQVQRTGIALTLRGGQQFAWSEASAEQARKVAESVVDRIDEETRKP